MTDPVSSLLERVRGQCPPSLLINDGPFDEDSFHADVLNLLDPQGGKYRRSWPQRCAIHRAVSSSWGEIPFYLAATRICINEDDERFLFHRILICLPLLVIDTSYHPFTIAGLALNEDSSVGDNFSDKLLQVSNNRRWRLFLGRLCGKRSGWLL